MTRCVIPRVGRNVGAGSHARAVDIASTVTTSAAAVSSGLSLFLLRQGQRDRHEMRRQAERDQAQHVTGWADWDRSPNNIDSELPNLPAIWVANASSQAIFDVFVDYRRPGDGRLLRDSIGPVPPGERRKLELQIGGVIEAGWEPAPTFPRVYFCDSSYRRWIRDSAGRLRIDDEWGRDDFFESGGKIVRPSAQAAG